MNQKLLKNFKESSLLSPAHGKAGVRAISLSFSLSVLPSSEKALPGFQQAGKKEEGLSVIPTRNFFLPTFRAKGAAWLGSGMPRKGGKQSGFSQE